MTLAIKLNEICANMSKFKRCLPLRGPMIVLGIQLMVDRIPNPFERWCFPTNENVVTVNPDFNIPNERPIKQVLIIVIVKLFTKTRASVAIMQMIEANNGKATLDTVNGGQLTAMVVDGKVVITDAKGGKSTVIIADVKQSNGVVHAVDAVLMPKK